MSAQRKTWIQVFDKSGKLLAEQLAKSTAARVSVRAAAWQRQLDGMLVPEASTAFIGESKFRVVNGRSQWSES